MSHVVIQDGIGYHLDSKAAFYTDGKALSTAKEVLPFITSVVWAPWGDSNQEPIEIASDIENCPVLSAGVKAEARLAVGKGLDAFLLVDKDKDGNETLEWVSDSEVNDFLEDNEQFKYSYSNIRNMLAYGWGATQFILDKGRNRINRIAATDVYTARLQRKDLNTGLINNMYLYGNWDLSPTSYDPLKMKQVPLLREGYELQDLQDSKSGYEFGILHRLLENGRMYYPTPPHRAAKAWVKISRSIPNIKNAMNINQMAIKYMISIAPMYWERVKPNWKNFSAQDKEATMQKTYDDIASFLTGELNAGKTIIGGKYMDPYSKTLIDDITIDVIDDKMKEGKMLPDSAAADKQILFSMMFNPAIWGGNLLGDGASGGAGSGSDIREATLVLMSLLHPERMNNIRTLDIIKRFNGWNTRLEVERDVFAVTAPQQSNTATMSRRKMKPRLVFRYSNSILTTLDTGGSTKPLTT